MLPKCCTSYFSEAYHVTISTVMSSKNMILTEHRVDACNGRSKTTAAGLLLVAVALAVPVATARCQSLSLSQRIELPAVKGRLDHLAFDVDEGRLFVAAVAADSVEVI